MKPNIQDCGRLGCPCYWLKLREKCEVFSLLLSRTAEVSLAINDPCMKIRFQKCCVAQVLSGVSSLSDFIIPTLRFVHKNCV